MTIIHVVEAREMLMSIGVERDRLRLEDLAAELGVNYDSASLWGRGGAKRRSGGRGGGFRPTSGRT